MRKEEKAQVIEELVGVFGKPGVYLMDFKGINVEEITELRSNLREANVSMRVVKNTLALRALREAGIEEFDKFFEGPTSVIWSQEDSVTPARLLTEFLKKYNKGIVKAALVEGKVVSESDVETLSKLPTKIELQAKVAATLNAPIVKLAKVVNALPLKLARLVDAVREKKENE